MVGWSFVAPMIFLLACFSIFPLLSSLWLSLHERHIFASEGKFVGLGNFVQLLHSDVFWMSLWNGLVFSTATVLFQLLIGVSTALLLNNRFKGRALVRGVILFPFVVPTVVAVLVWKWMLNDLYGVVNAWMMKLGIISEPIVWLASPNMAMVTVIAINVWLFFPFITIHVLARLQMIPEELHEAARVDGATAIQRFRYIILPQLLSTILLVVFIRGMWMFNKFDSVWLITEGGPLGATQNLPILAYLRGFRQFEIGAGAAVAATIFMILAIGGFWYGRWLRREAMQ